MATRRRNTLTITKHREILRRVLLGHKLKDIATDLGYHPQSVYIVVNNDSFQQELAKVQRVVLDHSVDQMIRLNGIVPDAVRFYRTVLAEGSTYDAKIKFGVAKDLLDRVGLREPDRAADRAEENDPARQIEEAFKHAKIIEAEVVQEAEAAEASDAAVVVVGANGNGAGDADESDESNAEKDIQAEIQRRLDASVQGDSGAVVAGGANGAGGVGGDQNDVRGAGVLDPIQVFNEVRDILGDEKIEVIVGDAVAGDIAPIDQIDIIKEQKIQSEEEEATIMNSLGDASGG